MVQMDMGSANTSQSVLNLLDRLGVEVVIHKRKNSRANGSVEKAHDIVENDFESGLRFRRVEDLADLNQKALQWSHNLGAQAVHKRYRDTRHNLWLTITREQLREAPPVDDMKNLCTSDPQVRTVTGNLEITFKVRGYPRSTYRLHQLPGVIPKCKVNVVVSPMQAPAIQVQYTDKETGRTGWMTVAPVEFDRAGFPAHAAMIGQQLREGPRTQLDRNRDRALISTYGGANVEEAKKNKEKGALAFGGRIDAFKPTAEAKLPSFLPRRSTPLFVHPRHVEEVRLSTVKAVILIRKGLQSRGQIECDSPYIRASLIEQFGERGVPEDLIPELIKRFGEAAPPVLGTPGELSVDHPHRAAEAVRISTFEAALKVREALQEQGLLELFTERVYDRFDAEHGALGVPADMVTAMVESLMATQSALKAVGQ
jgi:hypothetical protein